MLQEWYTCIYFSCFSVVQEKKRIYEEQQERMERTHTSFLDSIRNEASQDWAVIYIFYTESVLVLTWTVTTAMTEVKSCLSSRNPNFYKDSFWFINLKLT